MKTRITPRRGLTVALFALFTALNFNAAAFAADGKDAASADAKAAYPLTTCVVSGDELGGDMGEPVDYIHKEDGKPDRLVRFCCKPCIKDFKKDPAKYLKAIDDAMAAKPKGGHHQH